MFKRFLRPGSCEGWQAEKKAFDKVSHAAVAAALRRKGVPVQLIAVLCKMWSQSTVKVKLGHVSSDEIPQHRGVPQGAPESPLIFTCVVDDVLSTLLDSWSKRGLGWSVDSLWIPAVVYADDVLILAKSKTDASLMLEECMAAFAAADLEVGLDKTFWSSTDLPTDQIIWFVASRWRG